MEAENVVQFPQKSPDGSGLIGLSLRAPPANLEAEQAVLGAILANNRAYERVGAFLRPDHFADPIHARIYESIQKRLDEGGVADAVTLRAHYEANGLLDEVGGAKYLAELIGAMVSVSSVGPYGTVILDTWQRRQIIGMAETAVNLAFGAEPDLQAREQLARLSEMIEAIQVTTEGRGRQMTAGEAAARAIASGEAAFHRGGRLAGLSTGFRKLDQFMLGMEAGNLIILAARPAMGKTGLSTQIGLRNAAGLIPKAEEEGAGFHRDRPRPTGIISLEMSGEQIGRRALALLAGVPLGALRTGDFMRDQRQTDRLVAAQQQLAQMPLAIEDEAALTVSAIRQRVKLMQRRLKKDLELLIVDHMQIVGHTAAGAKHGRVAGLTEISGGLKGLAKELGIPIIVLSQLSRKVEERENKRPQLSDLRESGSIEQDADVAAFLYRAEYYHQQAKPERKPGEKDDKFLGRMQDWEDRGRDIEGKAEVIFEKVRDGQPGTAHLDFDGPRVRFSDPTEGHEG